MEHTTLEAVLAAIKAGELSDDAALTAIRQCFFQDIGHTTLDHDRATRTGTGEVVFGEGKTPAQIDDIVAGLRTNGTGVLVTRVTAEKAAEMSSLADGGTYHPTSRLAIWPGADAPVPAATTIAVVSAGTSDASVAEEAAMTAEFLGNPVQRINDVGVAGLHRLLARIEEIRAAKVVIVVAGMEGALPSVVGGLVGAPVIAVPTSVGYGAAFDGVAALLGMLNSCASGVSVVNIDNGFGAGHLANRINRL